MVDRKLVEIPVKGVGKMINMIPGTLVYKGIKKEALAIERMAFNEGLYDYELHQSCDPEFEAKIKGYGKDTVQWINVTGISNTGEIGKIGQVFSIGQMLLEQILDVSKHSLYKVTDQYVFSDFQMIYMKDGVIINETLSIYLSDTILVTFQERKGDVFESIRDRIRDNEGYIRSEDTIYTYFCILDALVDHYISVLEKMKSDIERLELKLMESETLDNKELHLLRKEILIIRLSAMPIEKLIQEILATPQAGFQKHKKYFDSLAHHVKFTLNEVALLKDSLDSLYENYMVTNANDMNRVMTILTIFSAIFIPLSFAAGVFGMNFETIPGLNNPLAFLYFIIGCGLTALMMLVFFKRNKWF